MAFPGYNVAATIPGLHSLWGRQSDGSDSGNSSDANGGADKWAIGNNTESSQDQYRWIFIVDQTILSLTVGGALAILLTMFILERKGRPATTRMRLVQSLVLSDLILGIVGMVGTSITLDGGDLSEMKASCDGLGFSLVAVLWTEHMWTMALAIATYMILIYPLHQVTMWLERKWYWLWGFVWVFAIAIAMIGQFVFGYFNTGGLCYYGPNAGLYGELIQFIPRTIVMLCISILYLRLYVFLRRPDRIRASFSDSDNNNLYTDPYHQTSMLGRSSRAITSFWRRRKSSQAVQTAPFAAAGPGVHVNPATPMPSAGEVVGHEKILAGTAPVAEKDVANGLGDAGLSEKHEQAPTGSGKERPRRISLPPRDQVQGFLAPPTDQLSPRSISDAPLSFPFGDGDDAAPATTTSQPATPAARTLGRGSVWNPSSKRTPAPATPAEEVPPWEQIQLPIFHVDGERFGGASANASAGPSREGSGMWSSWKGLGGGRRAGRGSAGSLAGYSAAQTQSQSQSQSQRGSIAGSPPMTASTSARASISPIPTHAARMGSLDAAGLEVGLSPSLRNMSITDGDRERYHPPPSSRDRHGSTSTMGSRGEAPQPRKASAVSFPTRELTPIPSNTSTLDDSNTTPPAESSGQRRGSARSMGAGGSRRGSAAGREERRSSDTPTTKMARKFSLPIEYVPKSRSGQAREGESQGQGEGERARDVSPGSSTQVAPQRKGSLKRHRTGDLAMSQVGTKSVRLDDEPHFPDAVDERYDMALGGERKARGEGREEEEGKEPEKDFSGAYVYGARHGEARDRGSRDEEEAEVEEESDGEMDLMRMLQGSSSDTPEGRRNQEASYEFVEESMASYLNRKTALLMLWFPLGYVLLFSVSLVRIIYDFAARPPIVLRALSRWFVFAQGLLDAIIYGLVEWHTKRVVRKRVRKGTFNTPQTSRGRNSNPREGGVSNIASGIGSMAMAGMRVFSSRGPAVSGGAGVEDTGGVGQSRGQANATGSNISNGGFGYGARSRNSQTASQTQSHIGSILGPLDRSWDKDKDRNQSRSGTNTRAPIPSFDPSAEGRASSSADSGSATPTMPQGYEVGRHASVAPTMGSDGTDGDREHHMMDRDRERVGSGMTFGSGAPLLHGQLAGYGIHRGSITPSARTSTAVGGSSASGSGSVSASASASGTGTDTSRKGSDTSGMEDLGRMVR